MSRALRAQRRDVFDGKRDISFFSSDYPDLPTFTAPPPPRTPMVTLQEIPSSSNLAAAGYCPVNRVFAARFKNARVYHHQNVPQDLAAGFNAAESKGTFYAREIKAHHPGELVVDAVQPD